MTFSSTASAHLHATRVAVFQALFCLACTGRNFSYSGPDNSKRCLKVVFTLLSIVAIEKRAPELMLSCGIVYKKMMSKFVQFLVNGFSDQVSISSSSPLYSTRV